MCRGVLFPSLLLPTLLLPSACSFGFEASSELIDLRVLAVSAEPPEVVSGDGVSEVVLSALVVDARAPERLIPFEWRACVPGFSQGAGATTAGPPALPGGGLDTTQDPRCNSSDESTRLQKGVERLDALSLTVPVPGALVGAVDEAASRGPALSLYVNAELTLDAAEGPVQAFKRITVSPRIPEGRVANRNPRLQSILFDGQPWEAGTPLVLEHGACDPAARKKTVDRTRPGEEVSVCPHKVTPLFAEDEPETYRVRTFDGRDIERVERLRFAWFVEHGSFSDGETEEWAGIGPRRYDPLSTEWFEPPEAPEGDIHLWVVVRDGRGGTGWERRTVRFAQ